MSRADYIRISCYSVKPCIFISPCGNAVKDTFSLAVDERGNYKLEKTGNVDVYKQIQSYAKGCDIHEIVARYNVTGDPNILNIDWSRFGGDAVGVPTDLRSAYTVVKEAEKVYKSLKPEVAKNYNSFADFLVDVNRFKPVQKNLARAAAPASPTKEGDN